MSLPQILRLSFQNPLSFLLEQGFLQQFFKLYEFMSFFFFFLFTLNDVKNGTIKNVTYY
jgi:hypothetical protein